MKDYKGSSPVGWARIYRQLTDSDFWLSEPFTKPQAWIDLIVNANYRKGSFWVRGIEVQLERGQIGWSEITMARRWGWSRGRTRRFLFWLEKDGKIVQQKNKYVTTIISLVNYDKWQSEMMPTVQQAVQQAVQQPVQQTVHKQEDKNIRTKEIDTFLSQFNSLFGGKYQPTVGRVAKLRLRLKAFSLEQILSATKNLSSSPWHQGKNDRGWKADPDFLLRSDEQIDKWLNHVPEPGKEAKPRHPYIPI